MGTGRTAQPAATATLLVAEKDRVADDVVALTLVEPGGGRLRDWAPGAHIDVVLPTGEMRQYSLCGDRFDPFAYRIAVRREEGGRGGSAWLHDSVRTGRLLPTGGPRNTFPLVPSEEYVFIAGGIGITPLLPMLAQAEVLGARWTLHYCGRSRASMPFLDELGRHGDRVRLHPRDEGPRLDVAALVAAAPAEARIYCCGPVAMVEAVERAGAPRPAGSVRAERFSAAQQPAPVRDAPFEVVLARSGTSLTVDPSATVLQALEGAGVRVLTSCGQGLCGTCETTVLEGRPDHRDSVLDAADRAAGDCMLVCVSRACSDRLVLDL
ncbi:ferredoxin-NADP reductase [Kineococcus xinjiangensis]|uniref:Ferredoxin-NADP reductase n=1 Tax=Kineococcus xinjiangensis TaxID=512762 RepID=A0A2S6IWV4_9ACTN|nr:PDR/VanB family oxidoreductase [Kineococcus xinjiangensis]PPK98837.1 ferredoxin-NADP reductase [Kineococcus xinjiangensis]